MYDHLSYLYQLDIGDFVALTGAGGDVLNVLISR